MLTQEQAALVARGLVMLAGPHEMHVKTPAGAKFYKEPIGSLIVAKPHEVGTDKHVVFVGNHYFEVPDKAVVYVPPGTDLKSDAAVAAAKKAVVVWNAPGDGTIAILEPNGTIVPLGKYTGIGQIPGWKQLHEEEQKVPVVSQGKLLGWVPHDWKLYAVGAVDHPLQPGDSPTGVWAHKPGDNADWWHLLTASGDDGGTHQPQVQQWINNGILPVYDPWKKTIPEGTVPPGPNAPSGMNHPMWPVPIVTTDPQMHGMVKLVTGQEISKAIEVLQGSSSTAVKQPLAAAHSPLAEMDYHAISKEHLKKHPELKVSPGSKNKHVGQVKVAVMHWLAEAHDKLAASAAEMDAADQAKADAEAKAAHAQTLANQKKIIGGIPVTDAQIQQAIDALEATKSTAIKQILQGKKNPLAAGDYWMVVNNHKKLYPGMASMKAKETYVAALKAALANPNAPVPAEPPTTATLDKLQADIDANIASAAEHIKEMTKGTPAEDKYAKIAEDLVAKQGASLTSLTQSIHTLIEYGHHIGPQSTARNAVLATALQDAWTQDHAYYVVQKTGAMGSLSPGGYEIQAMLTAKPEDVHVYKVTPEHDIFDLSSTSQGEPYLQSNHFVLGVLKQWMKPASPEKAKEPEPLPMPPLAVPPGTHFTSAASKEAYKAIWAVASQSSAADWQKDLTTLNAMAVEDNAKSSYFTDNDMWGAIANSVVKARSLGLHHLYVYPDPLPSKNLAGNWTTFSGESYPTEMGPWWRVEVADGKLTDIRFKPDGQPSTVIAVPPSIVLEHISKYFKAQPWGAHAEPETGSKDVYVWSHDAGKPVKVGSVPAGTVLYYSTKQGNAGNPYGTVGSAPGFLTTYYYKTEDGHWHEINIEGPKELGPSHTDAFDSLAQQGILKPLALLDVLAQAKAAGASKIEESTPDLPEPGENAPHGPNWQKIHDKVVSAPAVTNPKVEQPTGDTAVAQALVWAYTTKQVKYAYKAPNGAYVLTAQQPAAGAPGAPGKPFYAVTPDHVVTYYGKNGVPQVMPDDVVVDGDWGLKTAAPGETAADGNALLDSPVPVYLDGKKVADAPPGSKVYSSSPSPGGPVSKNFAYWKLPDGEWEYVNKNGDVAKAVPMDNVVGITLQPVIQMGATPVVITVKGGPVGTAPAGSVVYHLKGQDANPLVKYVKKPDGKWAVYDAVSGETEPILGPDGPYEESVTSGNLVPDADAIVLHIEPEPEPPKELTPWEKVQKVLAHGAITPQTEKQSESEDYPTGNGEERALVLAMKKQSIYGAGYYKARYSYQTPNGSWSVTYTLPGVGTKYYVVSEGENGTPLKVALHEPGKPDTQIPEDKLFDLIGKWIVPDAVTLTVAGKTQVFHYGHYYNPKSKGASPPHLELQASGSGKFSSTYHDSKGQANTGKSLAYTKKALENMTEYSEFPKGAVIEAGKPQASYLTPFVVKTNYTIWFPGGEEGKGSFYKDDTFYGYVPTAVANVPNQKDWGLVSGWSTKSKAVGAQLKASGDVVDGSGNSVAMPGGTEVVHLFGSVGYTHPELDELTAWVEQQDGSSDAAHYAVTNKLSEGGSNTYTLAKWLGEQGADTYEKQHYAILGLLHGYQNQPGTAAAMAKIEPVYLQSMPPGIHQAKDIFEFNGDNYAQPFHGSVSNLSDNGVPMTSPMLADRIKAISAQFGGGKVVGTHVSGLTAMQRVVWLKAWKSGDMVTVFNLDKSTGKVSKAHPGAPDNPATWQVFWAPWGKGEVPAAKTVEGDWTDPSIAIPVAEVNNYLIKAGLQHPEFLSPSERRGWVLGHREHDQDAVDKLSRLASERFEAGGNPLGEKPEWTDNIQPAKSYTDSLEKSLDVKSEGWPVTSWMNSAVNEFVNDHEAELEPFGQQWSEENGYSGNSSAWKTYGYAKQVVQKWVDEKRTEILAELNKPKYHLVEPTRAGLHKGQQLISDQFGKQYVLRVEPPAKSLEGDLRLQQPGVSRLAGAFGFRTPNAIPVIVPGVGQGVGRQYLPAEGTMVDVPVKTLTPAQVSDIAREHVLDWLLDNADGHPGNFLRMSDGGVVGVDKDAAWKNFGSWDGLALDGSADAQAKQLSSRIYTAIQQHAIGKKTADLAYINAIRTARRMASMSDDALKSYLDAALAGRTHFPGKYDSRLKLEMAILKRKAGIAKDFEGLWSKVYAEAGWKLPEVPQEKLGHGLHSGFSEPNFFDHVMAAKSFGVPAFFAGTHLEDSGVQVWTERSADDKVLVRGETSVRGAPYAAMVAWAKQHQTSSEVNSNSQAVTNAPVPEAGQWYNVVVNAAKSVSRHAADQLFDGPVTSGNLKNLAELKTSLQLKLADAEAAQAAGPDSVQYGNYVTKGSWPGAYISAAKFYLDEVDRVYKAKEEHGTFKPGDFVQWKPPPKPPEPKKVKKAAPPMQVVLKKATREMANQASSLTAESNLLDPETGELKLDGHTVFTYPGKAWHVTLPTGEVIEINDGPETATPKGQTGRIRFRANASDGSKSLENIRAALQEMGIPMDEAEDADLELYYWRHLAGVLSDRSDRTYGKQAQVMNTLKTYFNTHKMEWSSTDMMANLAALSHLPKGDELALWHDAWAHMTSPEQVKQWAADSKHLPHMSHFDISSPDVPNGKPYWYRFDADPAWLAQTKMLAATGHHPEQDGVHWIKTGGAFSTEARIRALGAFIGGWSSSSDMSSTYGSAGGVFTRQNRENSMHIWWSPRVFARTSNYSLPGDSFGDISLRKTKSPFDLKSANQMTASDNETLIKDAIGLLDDTEAVNVYSEPQRAKLIGWLKDHGITEIRGMPVEQRIVTGATFPNKATAKSLNQALAPHWFDADKPYVPPQAAKVTAAQSAIYTEAELEGPKAASVGGLEYLETDPEVAEQAPLVKQVFWQAASKPSNAVELGEGLKKQLAYRLSNAMASDTSQILALGQAAHLTPAPNYVGGDREKMIGAFVNQWAATNNSSFIYALQQEVRDLFGVTTPDPVQVPEAKQAEVAQLRAQYGDVFRDFLMAQYQATQDDFAKAGVTHVTLRRAFAWGHQVGAYGSVVAGGKPAWAVNAKPGDVIDTQPSKALASWAIDNAGADMFAVGDSTTVEATVPVGLIFSYPRSGFGCYNESEVLAIDAPGKWKVVK